MDSESEENRRAAMSLFTLGKTYRWISRARVVAWFRTAFEIKGSSNPTEEPVAKDRLVPLHEMREMRKASMRNENRPKIFYILPKRDEALTLEKRSKSMIRYAKDSLILNIS